MSLRKTLFAVAMLSLPMLSAPVGAAGSFDGDWSVRITADTGKCDADRSVPMRVEGERVSYDGWLNPSAQGVVTGSGEVNVRFEHREHIVLASGALAGEAGRGRWTSPTLHCAGSWKAVRQ